MELRKADTFWIPTGSVGSAGRLVVFSLVGALPRGKFEVGAGNIRLALPSRISPVPIENGSSEEVLSSPEQMLERSTNPRSQKSKDKTRAFGILARLAHNFVASNNFTHEHGDEKVFAQGGAGRE